MNKKVICDTGIISRYLLNEKAIFEFVETNIGFSNILITAINKIELRNWLSNYKQLTKSERASTLKAIHSFPVIHINEPISKLAIAISDKNINAKPADIFIGATSIYHNIPIYTLNIKDFKIIKAPLYL